MRATNGATFNAGGGKVEVKKAGTTQSLWPYTAADIDAFLGASDAAKGTFTCPSGAGAGLLRSVWHMMKRDGAARVFRNGLHASVTDVPSMRTASPKRAIVSPVHSGNPTARRAAAHAAAEFGRGCPCPHCHWQPAARGWLPACLPAAC